MSKITDLPFYLFRSIILHLDYQHMKPLFQVNKQFYEYSNRQELWKPLLIRDFQIYSNTVNFKNTYKNAYAGYPSELSELINMSIVDLPIVASRDLFKYMEKGKIKRLSHGIMRFELPRGQKGIVFRLIGIHDDTVDIVSALLIYQQYKSKDSHWNVKWGYQDTLLSFFEQYHEDHHKGPSNIFCDACPQYSLPESCIHYLHSTILKGLLTGTDPLFIIN